jgi:hypothetical protein
MTRLNDLQLVLLTSAAQRADGNLLPPPDSIGDQAARIRKAIPPLIEKGLVGEKPADVATAWRENGDDHIGAFITPAGREAIGADEPAPGAEHASLVLPPAVEPTNKKPTKSAQVIGMLQREEGATLAELVEATGWLPHTTRAALTGLRKKGHAIAKGKRGDATCYSLAQAA